MKRKAIYLWDSDYLTFSNKVYTCHVIRTIPYWLRRDIKLIKTEDSIKSSTGGIARSDDTFIIASRWDPGLLCWLPYSKIPFFNNGFPVGVYRFKENENYKEIKINYKYVFRKMEKMTFAIAYARYLDAEENRIAWQKKITQSYKK